MKVEPRALPAVLRIVGLAGVRLCGDMVRVITMDLSSTRILPDGGSKNTSSTDRWGEVIWRCTEVATDAAGVLKIVGLAGVRLCGDMVRVKSMDLSSTCMLPVGGSKNTISTDRWGEVYGGVQR